MQQFAKRSGFDLNFIKICYDGALFVNLSRLYSEIHENYLNDSLNMQMLSEKC